MDFSTYETYGFDHRSAFNMSTGYNSYQVHWHSYGEIMCVGTGEYRALFVRNEKGSL